MYLETKRLIIRPYQSKDVKAAANYLMDPIVMHYLPEKFSSLTKVKDFTEKESQHGRYFPVCLKETDQPIGHLYFEAFFGKHSYEIGWVFQQDVWQKGYGYEASFALLDTGFKQKNIHRVIATCQPENTASYHLMEKLQMRREGEFKQCIPAQNGWWDEYYYAILQEEWLKKYPHSL
ncbi:GNAT family N-acetyltransferase [Vagococcus humatus]|uniref:GNAT family N-acetyltransferase n=1 Tax=Vagococcus humatus TaxID=1889241 RepID=A0A429Z8Q8_9ENTE|nr:GNAT family protein [Vagococcus humatus]RST90071.1 GNAT family N-acetyltransferase [Vagococcus humatus]